MSSFIGVDVGRKGAIALLNEQGLQIWDMPPEQSRGISLPDLEAIVMACADYGAKVGIEWNNCRPEEVPDFAMRFGIQSGELRAMFFAHGFQGNDLQLISPQAWMNKLGLPGKDDDQGCLQRLDILRREGYTECFHGPRGGVLDGRVEAACIALYMRIMHSTPLGKKTGPRKPKFRGLLPPESGVE